MKLMQWSLIFFALWAFFSLFTIIHAHTKPTYTMPYASITAAAMGNAIQPVGLNVARRMESGIIQSCVERKMNGPAFSDGQRCVHSAQQHRLVWESG